MATEAALKRAAEVLHSAEALAICTGAGMGVDSGLGTFRGRNAGVWAPLKALRMDFSEMSSPSWFTSDPRLSWAFWHFRHQAYTQGTPHAGYSLLAKWGSRMRCGLFSVTSNIDGHWGRTEGVGTQRLLECHGALTHLQCVHDVGRIWPTDPAQIAALDVPEWDLRPGEHVEFRPKGGGSWAPAIVAEDGASLVDARGVELAASAVRRPGGRDLMRVAEGCELPKCPATGRPARPNVLMFGDWGVNCARIDEQEGRFEAWLANLEPGVRLVVVEVGAGKAVPTIRHHSQRLCQRFRNATLVRINWDDSDVPSQLASRAVSVGETGALEALTRIDKYLQELPAPPGGCCDGADPPTRGQMASELKQVSNFDLPAATADLRAAADNTFCELVIEEAT